MSGSHRAVNRVPGRGWRRAETIFAVAALTGLGAVLFVHFHPAGSPAAQAAVGSESTLQASTSSVAATTEVTPSWFDLSSTSPLAAQTVSSTAPTPQASTSRVAATTKAAPPSPKVAPPAPFVMPTLTYVVRKGDTVTAVAAWFQTHGYGELPDAFKAALAANLSRIHPGQQITVSPSGITTSG